jgi:hypothetical protein
MGLDSHDHVEVDAAIYATSQFCAKSQYVLKLTKNAPTSFPSKYHCS